MKVKIDISFRIFDAYEERSDSGYYSPMSKRRKAHIEIDLKDSPFEQIMTIFHEVSHCIFDFLTKYRIEHKKRRIRSRNDDLRSQWKDCSVPVKHNGKTQCLEREEFICQKIEHVVSRVLRRHIPKKIFKKFFNN